MSTADQEYREMLMRQTTRNLSDEKLEKRASALAAKYDNNPDEEMWLACFRTELRRRQL